MAAKINNTKSVIVVGTDTNVGKTVVCGLLGRFLKENDYKVITQKWVQTGSKGFSQDISEHLKLMGITKSSVAEFSSDIIPYQFKFAASPHLASGLENAKISPAKIKKSFKTLVHNFDFVIVEGAGGILVPLNKNALLIDIAKELKLPVLLVVNNKLGAINHTLLTIESLHSRKMDIIGVVFNNIAKNENKLILKDNVRIISEITREKVFGEIPYANDIECLYKKFIPIGKKILSGLRKKN